MEISEEDIIHELKVDNQRIFEQVFKKYYPLLYYEARGYIKNKYLAEEIVCDIFTRIWQNRKNLFITSSLRDYLIKSVHNTCIDYYRQQKTLNRLKSEIEEMHHSNYTLRDLGENPLNYIMTKELEEKIQKAIDSLPSQYKKAFQLSRNNDLTYDEIAEEMGISVNSVKTNIKNALAKLREQLVIYLTMVIFIILQVLFFSH